MFIDDVWLSTEKFTHKLNSYYVENHNKVDFPEIPAGGIPMDIPEHEVFKLLENIDTHKATSSADFASWISKNNSHLLCAPVTDIINSILSSGKYPKL